MGDEDGDKKPPARTVSPEPTKSGPRQDADVTFPHGNPGDLDPANLLRREGGAAAVALYLYGEEAKLKATSADEGVERFKDLYPRLLELSKDPQNLGAGDDTWMQTSVPSWEVVKELPEGGFAAALLKGVDLLNKWSGAASRFFGREAAANVTSITGLDLAFQLYQAHVSDTITHLTHVLALCETYKKLTPDLVRKLGDRSTVSEGLSENVRRLQMDLQRHSRSLTGGDPPKTLASCDPVDGGVTATKGPPISILKKEPAATRVDRDLRDQEEHRRFTLQFLERLQRPPDGGRPGRRDRQDGEDGEDPPEGKPCGLCHEMGHQQDRCPYRFPSDGRGPYCSRCGKRGHQEWDCPLRPDAPPCSYCGEYGHTGDSCPLAARRERRIRDERPERTMEEKRLALKAGFPSFPPEELSDLDEPPQENPRLTIRRQLRRDRRLQQEQAIERVSKEETRQQQLLLADLPRIRRELMFVITSGQCTYEGQLTDDQRKKLEEAMIQVYTNQLARPPGRGVEEAHSSASLRELGVDHITKFNGLEHKYAIKLFLTKFEEIRSFKKWNSQVSASALGQLLDGTALDFYENYKKQYPPGTRLDYEPLRDALLTQFYQKFTLSEKTKMMTNLKYDVARHRSHIHFMTECQKQSFLIYDRGPTMDNETELITRRQAREEMVLMFFVAGCAPIIRHEIEYSRAETKGQIEAAIRRKEEAIRAQDTSGRHDLEPGYNVKEVSLEQIEAEMTALQYPVNEIHAVMRAKGGRPGERPAPLGDITCYYCEVPGHRRSECPALKRDQGRNQVHPDKSGPNASPSVDALAKKGRSKPTRKGVTPRRKEKPGKPRSRKVNEVDLEEEASTETSSSESEVEVEESGPRREAVPSWGPPGWGAPPWPTYWPYQPPAPPRGPQQDEALHAAEITRQGVRKSNPYDLL